MSAAFLAPSKALVDAVVVRLVGDDEHTTVGRCCRCGEQECTSQDRGYGSHATPKRINEWTLRLDKPKTLRMINHGGLSRCVPKRAILRPLTQSPPRAHGSPMNGFLAMCGFCREIMS